MIDEIINLAISNGLWAVLFVMLFLYQIQNSQKRERKYQDIIDSLTNSLGIIKNIDSNIKALSKSVAKFKKLNARADE
ncbi:MAG: bacteriocin [Clostridia bacterium]|nr:bacteriocin [Clostridia bacterium]